MSYSWSLPSAPSSSSSPSSAVSVSSRDVLAGLLDQVIDPVSLDFVDGPNGEWLESADSRSIVLCQLEIELGRSYTTPGDGTDLRARLESGDPITSADVEAEVRRALAVLIGLGVIADLNVEWRDEEGNQITDEGGRAVFLLTYTDLATGSPVEAVYNPLGG